jgi:hypothetical protein
MKKILLILLTCLLSNKIKAQVDTLTLRFFIDKKEIKLTKAAQFYFKKSEFITITPKYIGNSMYIIPDTPDDTSFVNVYFKYKNHEIQFFGVRFRKFTSSNKTLELKIDNSPFETDLDYIKEIQKCKKVLILNFHPQNGVSTRLIQY